ncbi:MAG: formamidopyrimidine-DNA glycosylase [Sandaracinaceae bacterium]|nr:formamidopyrimidine-DNA glycosylase [Sandaracinaceae bacterium]
MPELPDVTLYVEALARRVTGRRLEAIRLASPFVLRTVEPPIAELVGRAVEDVRRIGKRVVLALEGERFVVVHLMVAGRFAWADTPGAKIPARIGLAALDFEHGTLLLREASKKKRASIHLVRGAEGLAAHDRGGAEPLEVDLAGFAAALTRERHTLKRALTDQRLLSGIGNAYSDEILHRAKLSPMRRSDQLDETAMRALYEATRAVLSEWTERLRAETGDGFPEGVTAFRPEMAVHGKYKSSCPVCGGTIMRIRYADNEANYCPTCQTEGRLLADRSLSRLLKASWPKTLEELEGG